MRSALRPTAVGLGLTLVALGAAVDCGCASKPSEDVAVVRLAITTIPSDVNCLRLTAVGARTVIQQFDVTPGTSSSLLVTGMPTGDVVFTADAFAATCALAGDRTTANWTSDPTTIAVSTSEIVDLSLVLHRNGRLMVGIDFQDDVAPTCSDGIQNGSETGVDCGGPTCGKCGAGARCHDDTDCAPGTSCDAHNNCRVNPPTCSDGIQNQDETGVDCGGATCGKCGGGASCRVDADCEPGSSCAGFRCRPDLSCVLPAGAAAWWRAEGNYLDSIGTNDGTPFGNVPFVPGFIGTAFGFDGVSLAYVAAAPDLDVTSGFTVDAWVNIGGETGRIIDKVHAFNADGFLFDVLGGRLRIDAGGAILASPDLLPTGNFIHVAGVFDGVRIALFVNGLRVAETPAGITTIPANTLPVRIGADSDGGSRFTGIIDQPRIFIRGLTDAEVRTLYLQSTGCP